MKQLTLKHLLLHLLYLYIFIHIYLQHILDICITIANSINLKEREKGISLVGNNKVKAYNKKCCIAMNVASYFALIQCERHIGQAERGILLVYLLFYVYYFCLIIVYCLIV